MILCILLTFEGDGKTWHENNQQSDILRSADLRTFRQHECDLIYGGNGDVKKQHICAYYEGISLPLFNPILHIYI